MWITAVPDARQCLIQLHQQRDAGAFAGKGRIALFNDIGGHDGEVVDLDAVELADRDADGDCSCRECGTPGSC